MQPKVDGADEHKQATDQQNNITVEIPHACVVSRKPPDCDGRKRVANGIESAHSSQEIR